MYCPSTAKLREHRAAHRSAPLIQGGRDCTSIARGSFPNNFGAIRVGENSALSTFAGPYSGNEQYRFYVPQLPGHDVANLSFDLLAFGA